MLNFILKTRKTPNYYYGSWIDDINTGFVFKSKYKDNLEELFDQLIYVAHKESYQEYLDRITD